MADSRISGYRLGKVSPLAPQPSPPKRFYVGGVTLSGTGLLTLKEHAMIGVLVMFRYEENFDDEALRRIADSARAKFDGMPGLRSKAFTVNPAKREATNFYIWDQDNAAKDFFTDALLERVTAIYGVRPIVEFVEILALVENAQP
jgi:hypothetical protein